MGPGVGYAACADGTDWIEGAGVVSGLVVAGSVAGGVGDSGPAGSGPAGSGLAGGVPPTLGGGVVDPGDGLDPGVSGAGGVAVVGGVGGVEVSDDAGTGEGVRVAVVVGDCVVSLVIDGRGSGAAIAGAGTADRQSPTASAALIRVTLGTLAADREKNNAVLRPSGFIVH